MFSNENYLVESQGIEFKRIIINSKNSSFEKIKNKSQMNLKSIP